MRMGLNALQILLVLFVFQRECRATKCYQCNSKKDGDCTINKVDLKYLKPCPTNYSFCRKAVFIYYFMDSREYVTIRECAKHQNTGMECYRGRYTRDSYQLVCECKGAGCNRSSPSSPESYILLYVLCQLVIRLSPG